MINDFLIQFLLGGARACLHPLNPPGWRFADDAKAILRWVAYTEPTHFEPLAQEHMRTCDECSGRNFFNRLDTSTVN